MDQGGEMATNYEIMSLLENYGYNFRVITLMHITKSFLYIFHMFYVVIICLTLWNLMKYPINLNHIITSNKSTYMSWYQMKKLNYILILKYIRIYIIFQFPQNIWMHSKYYYLSI